MRVGSLDHAAGGTVHQVTKINMHPDYNTNTKDSDYAILHLTYPVTDIIPVAITERGMATGEPVSLYGWGTTGKLSNEYPRTLQQLQTTFISSSDCEQGWSDVNPVTATMNSDAAPEKNQGSCSHDQGGPVVNEPGELLGIIGYYDYCEQHSNGRPDVNNDPLSASGWIVQNTI